MNELEDRLGIDKTTKEGWYNVTKEIVHQHGGGTMLVAHFGNSVYKAVMAVYPEHPWLPWKFVKAPRGFWHKPENQRWFLEWLYSQLGFSSMEDWYKVRLSTIMEYGGGGLMLIHKRSISKALQTAFPEHPWLPWKFAGTSTTFWYDRSNRRHFFEWLRKELNIQDMADWYKVTLEVRIALD